MLDRFQRFLPRGSSSGDIHLPSTPFVLLPLPSCWRYRHDDNSVDVLLSFSFFVSHAAATLCVCERESFFNSFFESPGIPTVYYSHGPVESSLHHISRSSGQLLQRGDFHLITRSLPCKPNYPPHPCFPSHLQKIYLESFLGARVDDELIITLIAHLMSTSVWTTVHLCMCPRDYTHTEQERVELSRQLCTFNELPLMNSDNNFYVWHSFKIY